MAVVAGVSLELSSDDEASAALSAAAATSEPPTASAASVGDEIEPPSLDSCEDGELDPIEPSQPPPDESDESLGPAASAASLGDEMPPPESDESLALDEAPL